MAFVRPLIELTPTTFLFSFFIFLVFIFSYFDSACSVLLFQCSGTIQCSGVLLSPNLSLKYVDSAVLVCTRTSCWIQILKKIQIWKVILKSDWLCILWPVHWSLLPSSLPQHWLVFSGGLVAQTAPLSTETPPQRVPGAEEPRQLCSTWPCLPVQVTQLGHCQKALRRGPKFSASQRWEGKVAVPALLS